MLLCLGYADLGQEMAWTQGLMHVRQASYTELYTLLSQRTQVFSFKVGKKKKCCGWVNYVLVLIHKTS